MSSRPDLTSAESHFAFGRNWASYAERIGDREIDGAVDELRRLVGGTLDGKRFLDIGSGSGLHSLAALRLGASSVTSIDLDADSVDTTRAVLVRHAPDSVHDVRRISVLDMVPAEFGDFDVVYAWGVLHHTGHMHEALRRAAAFVRPGGQFVFALYRKTWSCWFWRLEKRWYSRASARAQAVAEKAYISVFALALSITGRRFDEYVQNYGRRGMDYYHDVRDWLGGYPYESISPKEVHDVMTDLGLERQQVFARSGRLLGRSAGLLGSGCDEFVYVRP